MGLFWNNVKVANNYRSKELHTAVNNEYILMNRVTVPANIIDHGLGINDEESYSYH